MTRKANNRGSILLLVVGLLTIIALLGSTFLFMSILDAKQSKALADKSPTEPIASGLVNQLQTAIQRDLWIGGNGPYAAADPNAVDPNLSPWNGDLTVRPSATWRAFIDCPRPAVTGADPNTVIADSRLADIWLTSPGRRLAGNDNVNSHVTRLAYYSRLSDIAGRFIWQGDPNTPDRSSGVFFLGQWDVSRNAWNWTGCVDRNNDLTYNDAGDPNNLIADHADTDGDGWPDALLFDTGATNPQGVKYWAAVKVTDLSGLLCLNTAAGVDPNTAVSDPNLPPTVRPVYVDLNRLLGNAAYDPLHGERCGVVAMTPPIKRDLMGFSRDSAERLLNPDTNGATNPRPYLPFGIGDEAYLRFLGPSPLTLTGRVYAPAGSDPNYRFSLDARRMLTTYAVSRSLPRHAAGSTSGRIDLLPTAWNSGDPNLPIQKALYAQLVAAAGAGSDVAAKKTIAHFVANLWAFISPITAATQQTVDYGFEPEPTVVTKVYGVVPQLVISDAYGYYLPPSSTGVGDDGYANAIELFNPTFDDIDISKYRLKCNGKTWDFSSAPTLGNPAGTVRPGGRIVLYSFWGNSMASGSRQAAAIEDFGFGATADTWCNLSGKEIDFDPTNGKRDVEIVRAINGFEIPVDKVQGSEFNFSSGPGPGTGDTPYVRDGLRDDAPFSYRVIMAKMAATPAKNVLDSTPKAHKLGVPNGVVTTDTGMSLNDFPQGYKLWFAHGGPRDLSQLGWVHITGPDASASKQDLPHALAATYAGWPGGLTRGRLDFRGAVPAAGVAKEYPDLPWATMLGELLDLVPSDSRRMDEMRRIYGRININTATEDVLRYLPWPATVIGIKLRNTPTNSRQDEIGALVKCIVAYRDKKAVNPPIPLDLVDTGGSSLGTVTINRNYSNRAGNFGTGITDLRAASDFPGFLTPGEIAIPLADFYNSLWGWQDYSPPVPPVTCGAQMQPYLDSRDALYGRISNVITVNSDTFAANILIQLGNNPASPTATWRYLTVMDRSGVRTSSTVLSNEHRPAVLLFSQMP